MPELKNHSTILYSEHNNCDSSQFWILKFITLYPLPGWGLSFWWNCFRLGSEEVKERSVATSSTTAYMSLYEQPPHMYSSIFYLAVLGHVMVSMTGKNRQLWWISRMPCSPKKMLNFLIMWTINHKSPNISIQYCLPTCLVGFHCTKKLTTEWEERSDWLFKSAVENSSQSQGGAQRCLREWPPGWKKQKVRIRLNESSCFSHRICV